MRLAESEAETLRGIASSLVGPRELSSLCAYGSRVAGYSRPDSDYDLLAIARKFGEGVRYRYVDEPVAASVLIIEEGLLVDDARSSTLGEFAIGRLLNVYDSIVNGEFLKKVEVEYKRRVIMEALIELSSDYGDFGRNLLVPYDYFLFSKLRKRSVIYPPALYSYVQTYSCPQAAENREFTLSRFREAAEGMAPAGFLVPESDYVRIVPEKMRGDAFTKLSSLFSLTARGVTQYAVHGYAGRVGLGVFKREASSKLKRIKASASTLPELEKPKSLLRLEEGAILPDASKIDLQLAKLLGLQDFCSRERYLGEPTATTKVVTLEGGGKKHSFVVKNFSDVRSLKWALLGFWAMAARKFSMTPIARLEREYRASLMLRAKGILTPKIVALALDERILVKEYIDGTALSELVNGILNGGKGGLGKVEEFAEIMAKAHAAGFGLGDTKASNVVVASDGLYLTDLEQAVEGGDKAWDLTEFLFYTAKFSVKEEGMERVARAFLEAYRRKGDPEMIKEARKMKYFRPFQPFVMPGMSSLLRDVMLEYS